MKYFMVSLLLVAVSSVAVASVSGEHIRRKAIVTKVVTNRVMDAVEQNNRHEICEYLAALKTSAEDLLSLVENSDINNEKVSEASEYVFERSIALKVACRDIGLDDLADIIDGMRRHLDIIKQELN